MRSKHYDEEEKLLPPPAYKVTSASGQKRRFPSQGDVKKGKVHRTKQNETCSNRCTKGGYNTKVKYYSTYELKYYASLSKMGFFDIKQPFDEKWEQFKTPKEQLRIAMPSNPEKHEDKEMDHKNNISELQDMVRLFLILIYHSSIK